jgi:antitoxin VapB
MGMHINNPEVERKVRSLAETLGTTLTEAIDISVSKELRRSIPPKADPRLMRDLGKILDRIDRLPVLDTRSADQILGYTKNGTFD